MDGVGSLSFLFFWSPLFLFFSSLAKRLIGGMTRNQRDANIPICRQVSRLVIGLAIKGSADFLLLFATWFRAFDGGLHLGREGKHHRGFITSAPKVAVAA
jgi:uncharacterized membrane protein